MDAARSGHWRASISLRKLLARLPVQRVATLLPEHDRHAPRPAQQSASMRAIRRIERARNQTRDHVIGRIVQNVGRIAQRLRGFGRYL